MTAYGATPAELNDATCLEAARWYLDHQLYPIPWEARDNGRKAVVLRGFTYDEYLSTPPERITELLALWESGWQVGLALAEPGGVFAVDVDKWEELHEFERNHGELPRENDTWWHSTGRDDGGAHILFQRGHLLNDWPSHGPFSRKLQQLELKSKGFIAVPPSVHPSGRKYQWSGTSSGISGTPNFLAAFLNQRQIKRTFSSVDGNGSSTASGIATPDLMKEGIPEGIPHDNALRDLVWDLVQQGLPDAFIQSTWQVVVDKTPLLDPHSPWTQNDFERHLRGAREKLGGGLSAAELSWIRRTGVSPVPETNGSAAPPGPAQLSSAPVPETSPGTGAAPGQSNGSGPSPAQMQTTPGAPPEDGIPESPVSGIPVAPAPPSATPAAPSATDIDKMNAAHREWLVNEIIRWKSDGSMDLISTYHHLPYSDLASAQLIGHLYNGRYRFSTQERCWRVWDKMIYTPANDGDVANMIVMYSEAYRNALRRIKATATAESLAEGEDRERIADDYRDKWKKHRTYRDLMWNQPRQNQLVKQMEIIQAISETKFDADQDIAVCENGVLVLGRGGVVRQDHDLNRLVTKRLCKDLSWDPAAQAPVFHSFLESSVRAPDQRDWLQLVLGMALFGRPMKGFVNFIGQTDSGKSTLSRLLHTVFGTYAAFVGIDTFLEGSAGNNEFRIHELKGMRLVLSSEPAQGRKIDSEAIKTITGQDRLRTRLPYGHYVEWAPKALIVISSNHAMRLDTADVAMMKRLRPVEFTQADAVDPTLERRIRNQEMPGILAWLVAGAERAMKSGEELALEPTRTMVQLREKMAENVDDVLQFLTESLDQGWLVKVDNNSSRNTFIPVADLYTRYTMWCMSEGVRNPIGKRNFTNRIDRLHEVVHSTIKRFRGLAVAE
jgi:P4 family phage/plasmid primase-like protien